MGVTFNTIFICMCLKMHSNLGFRFFFSCSFCESHWIKSRIYHLKCCLIDYQIKTLIENGSIHLDSHDGIVRWNISLALLSFVSLCVHHLKSKRGQVEVQKMVFFLYISTHSYVIQTVDPCLIWIFIICFLHRLLLFLLQFF